MRTILILLLIAGWVLSGYLFVELEAEKQKVMIYEDVLRMGMLNIESEREWLAEKLGGPHEDRHRRLGITGTIVGAVVKNGCKSQTQGGVQWK